MARVFQDPRSLLLDIPVAVLLSAISILIAPLLVRVLGQTGWVSMEGMRPNNGLEIAAWIVAAISAGIVEETVFRGYRQQQFTGWTGHLTVGILGQSAIFGLAHGFQGWKNMTLIFALDCIFGAFVRLRKGLRANKYDRPRRCGYPGSILGQKALNSRFAKLETWRLVPES